MKGTRRANRRWEQTIAMGRKVKDNQFEELFIQKTVGQVLSRAVRWISSMHF